MEDIPPSGHREIEGEVHVPTDMENINIVSQLVISIGEMLESLPTLSLEHCIYRVPVELFEVNLKAYMPRMVSFGPFHHGDKNLQAMEEHKLRYLQTFLKRIGWSLEDCVEFVRKREKRVRCCYAETIKLSSEKFVKMILLDGCFIVELLLRSWNSRFIDENDCIFNQQGMSTHMKEDMMLLENQLPFFVLADLFNLYPSSVIMVPFPRLIHSCFDFVLEGNELPDTISSSSIKHFVDFIHCCYQSSIPDEVPPVHEYEGKPPTATDLYEAGIKFKKRTDRYLCDIKFTNGILEIPCLAIWDRTETLFRNLIAFEQCHRTNKRIFSYMDLFDGLINTSKDVDLLIRAGIIECGVGSSEDVTALFNNICKHVITFPPFHYSSLCKDLHEYCKRPWNKWKATLKRDYFNTPWKIVSIIVAVVLLILTSIQAVCSLISL